jgi:ATP-dependent Clp protease adaptor protein ClpS
MSAANPEYELDELLVVDEASTGEHTEILVLNDDFNTFEWVIECFMDILNHTSEQSEQLAWIIHTKGRASVKVGPFEVLKPLKDALCDRGLNAIIEHERVSR